MKETPKQHVIVYYYNVLLSTMDAVVESLKDGVKLSEVYNAAVSHVKKTKPELQGNLVKSIGWVEKLESFQPLADAMTDNRNL